MRRLAVGLVARVPLAAIVTGALGVVIAACADDGGDGRDRGLSAAAQRGAEIARDSGCDACHRAGAIAPDWEGLYGSTVELDDGSTVVADDEYLTRAITDPQADVVAGFNVNMPDNDLSDDEVASIVAYLRELGDDAEPTGGDDR
jgi:cytochrome c oxidase subunit 2